MTGTDSLIDLYVHAWTRRGAIKRARCAVADRRDLRIKGVARV